MTISGTRSKFRWPLFLAYTVFLYVTFTLPAEKIPPALDKVSDKLLHFLCFLILALLAFWAFIRSKTRLFRAHAGTKSAAFSLFYGALLEWAQRSVPGRSASFFDWLADAVGVAAAGLIFFFQKSKR